MLCPTKIAPVHVEPSVLYVLTSSSHRDCKVLNMKPAEILGMLEEAAGTRMYENKKEGALRTLDKKQLKVDEIQKVRGAW